MPDTPFHLLIIEDDLDFLPLIRDAFENGEGRKPWKVTVATDGGAGLDMLLGVGSSKTPLMPNLVLLDWNLPVRTGSEVLQCIKAHPEFRKIPILVFSSSDNQRDLHEAYSHHANGYIKKPNDLDMLAEVAKAIEIFWLGIAKLVPPNPKLAPAT